MPRILPRRALLSVFDKTGLIELAGTQMQFIHP